jgi:signal transduction histidine kinase
MAAQTAGPLTPALTQLVDIAQRNSERLVRLVNDIIDMERLETGKLELNLRPLDLCALLKEAAAANAAYGARFGVTYRVNCAEGLAPVIADSDRMLQVMANLLSNAAKFTRPNTSVVIGAVDDGEHVKISVIDQGYGISDSAQLRLFEKFSQGDHSNTREREGSGLGLSITKELLRQMNGDISYSTSSKGSTFYVRLPLAPCAETSAEAPYAFKAFA